eukprot:3444550-Amphidinium_carterae.1
MQLWFRGMRRASHRTPRTNRVGTPETPYPFKGFRGSRKSAVLPASLAKREVSALKVEAHGEETEPTIVAVGKVHGG